MHRHVQFGRVSKSRIAVLIESGYFREEERSSSEKLVKQHRMQFGRKSEKPISDHVRQLAVRVLQLLQPFASPLSIPPYFAFQR